MIFSDVPDPRLVTIRRGGTLTDADHHLLAVWAADCAEHVLHYFEQARPGDERPRRAIELARAWARGEIRMTPARTAAGHANAEAIQSNRRQRQRDDCKDRQHSAEHPVAHRDCVMDSTT